MPHRRSPLEGPHQRFPPQRPDPGRVLPPPSDLAPDQRQLEFPPVLPHHKMLPRDAPSGAARGHGLASRSGPGDAVAGHLVLELPSRLIPSVSIPPRPGPRSLRPRSDRLGPTPGPSLVSTRGCDAARSAVAPRRTGRGRPVAVAPSGIWPSPRDPAGATGGSPARPLQTDPSASARSAVRGPRSDASDVPHLRHNPGSLARNASRLSRPGP